MKSLRIPGLVAYVAMAMWLLQLAIAPARAEAPAASSRVIEHVEELKAALVASGAPQDARLTLAAPDALIAAGGADALAIDSVSYNAATGRFLIRAAAAPGAPLVALAGVAVAPVHAPVPTRLIARGEKIGEEDIDWIEITDGRAATYVVDADAIVGKIARRPLAAGVPMRKADLAAPILVKRGATATIVLEAPGIRLTQTALALANGAEGELIAFRNINSAREIKAVVAAENLARAPFAPRSAFALLETE